jgi:hypothetical protein
MSGHNGIRKFAETNRDGAIESPQVSGALSSLPKTRVALGSPATLSAENLLRTGGASFNAGAPAVINFPTASDWKEALELDYAHGTGYCTKVQFTNESGAPIVLQFPGGGPGNSMSTCDGTNQISIQNCVSFEAEVCERAPGEWVVTPIGYPGTSGIAVNAIQNLVPVGTGANAIQGVVLPNAFIRTFIGGNGINQTQNPNDVTFDFDGTNVGAGSQLFLGFVANQAAFRSIVGGLGLNATQNANDVTLDLDAISVGTGVPVYILSGTQAQFRSILGRDGINAVLSGADVALDFDGVNLGAVGSQIYAGITGGQASFRRIVGGTGITATQNATDITLTNTLTQQQAFTNSTTVNDVPTILLTFNYPMHMQAGTSLQTGVPGIDTFYRVSNFDQSANVVRIGLPVTGAYVVRFGQPNKNASPWIDLGRNIELFTSNTNGEKNITSWRSVTSNEAQVNSTIGTFVWSRPMWNPNTGALLPVAQRLLLNCAGRTFQGTAPSDNSEGTAMLNTQFRMYQEADGSSAAPPVDPATLAVGYTTEFGVNKGFSLVGFTADGVPAKVPNFHIAPFEVEYDIGSYISQNSGVVGTAVSNIIGLVNGIAARNWDVPAIANERSVNQFTIYLLSIQLAPVIGSMYSEWSLITDHTGAQSIVNIVQNNTLVPATHPPPTVGPYIAGNGGITITNGANTAGSNNRRFYHTIYVKRKITALWV